MKENESTAELKTDDNIPLKSNASLFIDRTKDMMEAQENVVYELAEKNGGKKGAENLVEDRNLQVESKMGETQHRRAQSDPS